MKTFITILLTSCTLYASVCPTLWINSKKVKATNPFFNNGITLTIEGRDYELGFREDGIVVWKYAK